MASNIRTLSAKAICSGSTTSLPFLYQTRTLCGSRKPIHQHAKCQRLSEPFRTQSFHSLPSFCMRSSGASWSDKQDSSSVSSVKSSDSAPGEDKLLIRRYVVDRKANKTERKDDLPWDSMSAVRPTTAHEVENAILSEADDIQFDMAYDPSTEDVFLEDEGEPDFSIPSARRPGESTITLEERETFQRIFSDIYARSQQAVKPQPQSLVDLSEVSQENARDKLRSIMEDSVHLPQNTLFTSQSREKNLDSLKQFPQSLRAVAARALGLQGRSPQTTARPSQEKHIDKYQEFRQKEQERVEAEMRAAPTDIALWAVIEKEVFSLIPRLGLEEKKAQTVSPKKRGRKLASPKTIKADSDMTPAPEPLDINAYFPLYASYLLYGLRLLNRSFSKPSPLACNVLPRIKSLGLVSHVLGGTTALYNELLRIYWFQYDDFNGVIRLLEEMEESGLEFDEETLDIVTDIQEMQDTFLFSQGQKTQNTPIHMLWTMNEFAPGRFNSWEARVRDSIERDE